MAVLIVILVAGLLATLYPVWTLLLESLIRLYLYGFNLTLHLMYFICISPPGQEFLHIYALRLCAQVLGIPQPLEILASWATGYALAKYLDTDEKIWVLWIVVKELVWLCWLEMLREWERREQQRDVRLNVGIMNVQIVVNGVALQRELVDVFREVGRDLMEVWVELLQVFRDVWGDLVEVFRDVVRTLWDVL